MPELPEVESVRRQLDPELAGRTITETFADPLPSIPREFHDVDRANRRTIERVGRRGKFLIAPLDDGLELIMHLGMTGSFRFDHPDPYVRAWMALDDGRTLYFRDVRRFGRIAVVDAGDYAAIPTLQLLGPEPLSDEFDPVLFATDLKKTTAPIKPYLLSQRPVAGVGNIYADEALWLARIHPAPTDQQGQGAGSARRHKKGIAGRHRPGGDHLSRLHHGQRRVRPQCLVSDCVRAGGRPCPRCQTALRKVVLGAGAPPTAPAASATEAAPGIA